ncbi:toll/interleukin-1 receptor domain-containing protein [Chondromyces apiculatus]|uniref:toll/interleukin-1 receptor domain-containing protein n=1 Tax=Chondromyces apiculatus TaxID=51 RepID=UPI0018CC263E|nr:toll/interleukin-1 receptor domain-containing protein [Chondromyces apiculatus]
MLTLVDPFEVAPGWFALEFVGFQVVRGPAAPSAHLARIDVTLPVLNTRDCCKAREEYVRNAWDLLPPEQLSAQAPCTHHLDEMSTPLRVVISYAEQDEAFLRELEKHLGPLKRQGVIDTWTKLRLLAGEELEKETRSRLEQAQVVILLVSVDLLASDFCYDAELGRALERRQAGHAAVIPILVRNCSIEDTPLHDLLVLPRGGGTVARASSSDDAWTEVVKEIKEAIRSFTAQRTEHQESPGAPFVPEHNLPSERACFGRLPILADLSRSLLTPSPARILLLGSGGIGKTTLSLAALHHPDVAARYGPRRYFVRLDAAHDAEAVAAAISAALRLTPGPEHRARALNELGREPALLVLDNLETAWENDAKGVEAFLDALGVLRGVSVMASIRGAGRPGGLAWQPVLRIQPLEDTDAQDIFCAIAGDEHRHDPRLGPLLAKMHGVPLAITLLAHAAQGNDLTNLANEWEQRRTELLDRSAGMPDRERSWAASLELSLASRRMTTHARRLASLLGVLPDGSPGGPPGIVAGCWTGRSARAGAPRARLFRESAPAHAGACARVHGARPRSRSPRRIRRSGSGHGPLPGAGTRRGAESRWRRRTGGHCAAGVRSGQRGCDDPARPDNSGACALD